jgi:hypothetical protein
VALDASDNIIDRFNFDYVTDLSGLGYALKVSVIESDVENYVTKIVQEKKPIGIKAHFKNGYAGGDFFDAWVEKNIDKVMCLEYDNTQSIKYIECKPVKSSKVELNEYGILEHDISLQPLSPFFEKVQNDVKITVSSIGKTYNLKYPYAYGKNSIENNAIKNNYIKDIPSIVTITGSISNTIVTLRDESETIYNEVRFVDTDLLAGEKIIINSAQKKIWFDDGLGNMVDYYYKLDGAYDSYLRAKPLATSTIGINLLPTDTGNLVGSRRQYKL